MRDYCGLLCMHLQTVYFYSCFGTQQNHAVGEQIAEQSVAPFVPLISPLDTPQKLLSNLVCKIALQPSSVTVVDNPVSDAWEISKLFLL